MDDTGVGYLERVAVRERFGKIIRDTGECLCVYCARASDYQHPRLADLVVVGGHLYNCLHCHSWTASKSGYCIHCNVEGYNEGQTLVHPPDVLPPLNYFKEDTVLRYKVEIAHQAQLLSGILFGPGEGHPSYRFRHSGGRWYPLGTNVLNVLLALQALVRYFTVDVGSDWAPVPTEQDKIWDAELAAANRSLS